MGTLGTRTPTTSDTRNSTTNTADSGVCAISPSDLVGYTGNALNRIKDLEQRVTELEAANVQVNQLSDLSQQVGWVGGVEYMGTAGWTQTEYGTLIPPAGVSFSSLGFTLSDGNTYPFVVMDENGVLQYGFTATGGVGGAAVAGKLNTYTGADQITYSTTPGTVRPFTGHIIEEDDSLVSSISGGGEITLTSTGFYLVGWSVQVQYPSGAGADKTFISGVGNGSGWYTGMYQTLEATGGNTYNQVGTAIFRNDGSPNSFFLQVADTGTASGTRTVDLGSFYIIKLRGI